MDKKQIQEQIDAIRRVTERVISEGPEACRKFLRDAGIQTDNNDPIPTEIPSSPSLDSLKPFGLSDSDLETLLQAGLKPEEIGGNSGVQHDRVSELIGWFLRYATGQHANPKWFQSHAFELVYYIATNSGNRFIDLKTIEQKAFMEGVNIPMNERHALETMGIVKPQAPDSLKTGVKQKLNIPEFSRLSAERAEQGFKTYRNVPITYWTTALMGEGGELCNMIKKMERVAHGGIDGGSSYTAASLSKEDLAEEIGGIFIYLNILSGLLDIDMEDAIIETFNSKSLKYGFSQFYPSSPSTPSKEPGELDRVIESVADRMQEGEVPEEILQWMRFNEDNHSHVKSEQDSFRCGAIEMYRKCVTNWPLANKAVVENFQLNARVKQLESQLSAYPSPTNTEQK